MDYQAYAIEIVAFQNKLQRKQQRKFGDSILSQSCFVMSRMGFYMRQSRDELIIRLIDRAKSFGAFENDKFHFALLTAFLGVVKVNKKSMAYRLAKCDGYILYE